MVVGTSVAREALVGLGVAEAAAGLGVEVATVGFGVGELVVTVGLVVAPGLAVALGVEVAAEAGGWVATTMLSAICCLSWSIVSFWSDICC